MKGKKYKYFRIREDNNKKEEISIEQVKELLDAYDTWTEKKLFQVLHDGIKLHPYFITKNKTIHYEYFAEKKRGRK